MATTSFDLGPMKVSNGTPPARSYTAKAVKFEAVGERAKTLKPGQHFVVPLNGSTKRLTGSISLLVRSRTDGKCRAYASDKGVVVICE